MTKNTTASGNVAIGESALTEQSLSGAPCGGCYWPTDNTAVGTGALRWNAPTSVTNGIQNTAIGAGSLGSNATGSPNGAAGWSARSGKTTGPDNVAIGNRSGETLPPGDNNLCILHPGVAGDNNVIRIGFPKVHAATYIAGIRGVTTGTSGAIPVVIDPNGQL